MVPSNLRNLCFVSARPGDRAPLAFAIKRRGKKERNDRREHGHIFNVVFLLIVLAHTAWVYRLLRGRVTVQCVMRQGKSAN
jgi:hypothetical protein